MPASAIRIAERRSERLIEELLTAQGWDIRRPPAGELLVQHEYRDFPSLKEALAEASKSGAGAGIPEFVLIGGSNEPIAVFEAKPLIHEIDKAASEASIYGDALHAAGFKPVCIAVAGTEDDRFDVRVLKRLGRSWKEITYEGKPIRWLPNRDQLGRIRSAPKLLELRPEIPPPEVLHARAEEINGLLREAGLKDDFRPAAIGAIMLGLWKSKGEIRRAAEFILADINQACERAFFDAKKPDLAKSLHVDEANEKLAVRAQRIVEILERLNIATLTAEHDYLGTLYEEFFRYTGGNTIGQYFTPRHVTSFMADLMRIGVDDTVLDPACGTGGFLIAAMERMQQQSKAPRERLLKIVANQLIGLEAEPVTASLCVANMVLRGDGSTSVKRADAFKDSEFPFEKASIVLMNPPFPHKKSDLSIDEFIDRALQGLHVRGRAAIITKTSILGKSDTAAWRRRLLEHSTLLAVISLPGELFQPYAAATTAILVFEKGIPHDMKKPVFFCRVENDGFRLKKGTRLPQPGGQLAAAREGFGRMLDEPGFSAAARLHNPSEWSPGAYIGARVLTPGEFREEVARLIRNKAAFAARFAPDIVRLLAAVKSGELRDAPYARRPTELPESVTEGIKIRDLFDLHYGQKALHSKEHLTPGLSLVISSSGADNGAYGFFDFPNLIRPPFVTVPSTGSIGEAAVQEYPCGVTDDCLLLIPKPGTPFEALYVAAATLRRERWRFDYGRKMTPSRIADFQLRLDDELLAWVGHQWDHADALARQTREVFGDSGGTSPPLPSSDEFGVFENLTKQLVKTPKPRGRGGQRPVTSA